MGNLLTVVVHSAQVQDYHGARDVLTRLNQHHWPRLRKIWADGIYKGDKHLRRWVKRTFTWDLEVVERNPQIKGFQVLPKRWVVERTFAWLGNFRRLSKDFEKLVRYAETWIRISMIGLMFNKTKQLNN